jgi:hypothetical protein
LKTIVIKTMEGIGDNLFIRPFVKILAESNDVYVETVLPRLYSDIPHIRFINPNKESYRTQQKQRSKDEIDYAEYPAHIDIYHEPFYSGKELIESSIISHFYKTFDIPFDTKLDWSLPDFSKELAKHKLLIPTDAKIAIVRPATVRREWEVYTRNPKPEYIAWCCKILNEAGYYTISIADLYPNQEWLDGGIDPPAQLKLHTGQLGIYATLELLKHAKIVVAGSGFAVPAAMSANTNLFLIFGGRLLYDGVSKILHPSMNLNKVGYAYPQNPCKCSLNIHNCDKTIPTLDIDFYKFLGKIHDN